MAAKQNRGAWQDRLTEVANRHLVESRDWSTMVLLLLALGVDYGERALIGALGPTLEQVFHFGHLTLGLLAAVSTVVAGLATVPLGWLTDRTTRVRLLAISLTVWAVAVGAMGAAVALSMFFGLRLLLGTVGAVTGPAMPSLVGDMVPSDQRARGLGLVESGQLAGTGLGFIVAAVVAPLLTFRWCFWLMALLGALLAVAFWRTREPDRTKAAGPASHEHKAGEKGTVVQETVREQDIAPSQRAILQEDPGEMSLWQAAGYVFSVRTAVVVLVSRAIGDYFLAAVSTFAVIFATKQYGVSQSIADLLVLVLGIGALLGFLLVGRLGDHLLDRGHLYSRLWLGTLSYMVAPVPLYFGIRTHTVVVALPLFTAGAFFVAGAGPTLDAVRLDVVVPRLRGQAESVRQLVRTVGEAGAPLVFGAIAATIAGGSAHGLEVAFLTTLPLLLLSGLVLLLALPTYGPDVAAALASSKRPGGGQAGGRHTGRTAGGRARR